MPGTQKWQPMEKTILLVKIWYCKLATANLNAEELDTLEESILENSCAYRPLDMGSEKQPYSEDSHTRKEAMLDFALAVNRCLSCKQLYRLTQKVLALQSTHVDHTFLRNNELARFLMMVEMGRSVNKKNDNIPKTLIAHLSSISSSFSDESLANFANTLLIFSLKEFKICYEGCSRLETPAGLSEKHLQAIREYSGDITDQLKDTLPSQPSWLDSPTLDKFETMATKSTLAIQSLFQKNEERSGQGKTISPNPPG